MAAAAVIGQLRRSFVGRAGAYYALQRQDVGRAKSVSRSAGAAEIEKWQSVAAVMCWYFTSLMTLTFTWAVMFRCATSLMMLTLPRASWPRMVWVTAGAKRRATYAPAMAGTRRR